MLHGSGEAKDAAYSITIKETTGQDIPKRYYDPLNKN
jgi:hypothetical protein